MLLMDVLCCCPKTSFSSPSCSYSLLYVDVDGGGGAPNAASADGWMDGQSKEKQYAILYSIKGTQNEGAGEWMREATGGVLLPRHAAAAVKWKLHGCYWGGFLANPWNTQHE